MKQLRLVAALLAFVPAELPAQDAPPVQISGQISSGVQQFDNDTNSSKFTEYRDIQNNFNLFNLALGLLDTRDGRFVDFSGTNLTRRDQNIQLEAGQFGRWRLNLDWNEIPHNLSNHAQSPFIQRAGALFEVPATIPITFKRLATAAADVPGVLASDELIAAYALSFRAPIDLRAQRKTGFVGFQYSPLEALGLDVGFRHTARTGTRLTYGPIGDRPPRTLNIEFTEPVDYRTRDVTLAAEHLGNGYQARVEYLFSDFANNEDTLIWQNIFATAEPGSDFDVWDRAVSVYGRRPLPPDNRYHHAMLSVGGDLPLQSHLHATVAYGRLDQNEALVPYSFHAGFLADPILPRASAQARMNTTHLSADYLISPVPRVSLRAFYRRYGLDNQTPEGRWNYVTSDTSNLNGTVSYKNRRVSLAHDYNRQNAGLESIYRFRPWRSSISLAYEHEAAGRDYREADSSEHIVRAAWRARPLPGVSVQARYLRADRDGSPYLGEVTRLSYWYAPQQATDFDNPQFTFSNHPDMRRHDVSDRSRHQVELTGGLTPAANFSLSASIRYRRDDFDADVTPRQPLLGTGLPEQTATSPGNQLGLLEDDRRQYTLDAFYAPAEQITVNAFVSWDTSAGLQRSLEFQENNKANPSVVANLELGPWTRAGSQWMADINDRTRTVGIGGTLAVVPERVLISANYTASLGSIRIDYSGFGVTNWDGRPFPDNHQFAFRTPPSVRHHVHVFDSRLELPIVPNTAMVVGYVYDRYRIDDWQQEAGNAWFEPVGSEYLLRDTSRSHQWGNRLFTMGSYLAPRYRAHLGYASFRYRF
jgi:MtrB/PioB family decaheme-associated outer membrane protein